jgi:Protein of unknown function (DUF3152)
MAGARTSSLRAAPAPPDPLPPALLPPAAPASPPSAPLPPADLSRPRRPAGTPRGQAPWDPRDHPPAVSRVPLDRPAHPPELPAAYAYLDEPPEPPRARRTRLRRRLVLAVVYLLLAGLVFGVGRHLRPAEAERIVVPHVATTGAPPGRPSPAAPSPVATAGTSGRFSFVAGYGPVLGGSGPVRRFRVAVEKPVGNGVKAGFADEVNRILGDRRSWIASRRFRLQRVPGSAAADFTIFLASARTSERMCRAGGLETDAYTSCRLPRRVIVNDDRWERSVRGYGAPLAVYRQYVINHEVGHQFGHGHEACPGKGRPAPVMMQQTYGLKGCTANAWPYRDGARYGGPPAAESR